MPFICTGMAQMDTRGQGRTVMREGVRGVKGLTYTALGGLGNGRGGVGPLGAPTPAHRSVSIWTERKLIARANLEIRIIFQTPLCFKGNTFRGRL